MGLEVPQELLARSSVVVFQNGTSLAKDDSREECVRLMSPNGDVVVGWAEAEGAREIEIALGDRDVLLFKLHGESATHGRRVKSASTGEYLVVAPSAWERDEAASGAAHIAPEPSSLDGYRAHRFLLEEGGQAQIAFTRDGEEVLITSPTAWVQLVGTRVPDSAEGMGPLFAGKPPRLRVREAERWDDVEQVVIGQAGPGRGRWQKAFRPTRGRLEQELPGELEARRGGWYFVRFYNQDDELVESLDFRVLRALRGVEVGPGGLLPVPDGHRGVEVRFHHEANCSVRLARGNEADLQLRRQREVTEVLIPPHPAWDLTCWEMGSDEGGKVTVEILVERLWWSLVRDGAPPSEAEWADGPLRVSEQSFRAASNDCIHLWLPRRRWSQEMLVGFALPSARRFRSPATERLIAIWLREFGDALDALAGDQDTTLKVWLADAAGPGAPICEVAHEPPKPPRPPVDPSEMCCCSTCDHARTRSQRFWCRREHWDAMEEDAFERRFARYLCGEWRGEYRREGGWCR